jgi:hypothetical protein
MYIKINDSISITEILAKDKVSYITHLNSIYVTKYMNYTPYPHTEEDVNRFYKQLSEKYKIWSPY